MFSQHSSIIWPIGPNIRVLMKKLSGCGFKPCCNYLGPTYLIVNNMWIFFHNEYFFIIVAQMFQSSNNKVQKSYSDLLLSFQKMALKKMMKLVYINLSTKIFQLQSKNYHEIKHFVIDCSIK